MNIKELRIDNYLKHTEDTIAELPSGTKTMLAKKDGEFKVSASTMYTMSLIEKKGVDPFKQLKYAPIPLNEEWLVKFGFKPISSLGEVFEKYIFNREEISCNMTILLNGGQVELLIKKEWITLPFKLEFVHSLQNLYFALTCEELTLKD